VKMPYALHVSGDAFLRAIGMIGLCQVSSVRPPEDVTPWGRLAAHDVSSICAGRNQWDHIDY
jgi:hypothetical protein